ncbi:hypothetical protein FNH22_10770 [Fulvivirga sp. M361]|uniref:alginate export family protein n=1 Tax=Fulvivirga sp. M361 TaxID=2594266 RepID=UPI00117B3EEC|nr:alginate export family protein [Fulvivirga sp. M361]TRX59004.1 hypothetical protein FNH22_10770 [Fulvivirga sp. M361]
MKKILYLLLMVSGVSPAYAQFRLSGEVRPRTEFYNGTNSSLSGEDNTPGLATQQRTRLYFQYKKDKFTFKFTPQYINFWGQQAQTSTSGSISVFEAWAAYDISGSFTLKFGRQPISYGDQRFFGALAWAAPGRSHDAFVGKFKLGDATLHAGFTLNQVGHTNEVNGNIGDAGNKSIQYVWFDSPSAGDFKYSLMGANVVTETDPGQYYAYTTLGFIPTLKIGGKLTLDASAYVQFGQFLGTDIGGSLLALSGTYKTGSIPITVGVEMVSGDDESTADKNETWKQQFGTNHKFYGLMDFFYVGEQPSMGLNDIFVKTAFKTGKKSKLLTHIHYFSTNQEFTDEVAESGETADGYLGTEIDLIYDLKVSPEFNVKVGYSQLFADDSFELFKTGSSDETNNWAWLQLTLKTSIFDSTDQ